jgi:cation:H+ antiporter
MTILMLIGGLVLLVAGADLLVRGASKFAISFGISPLVVGLTIVAFGTSAPEVAVSVGAVLQNQTDIAIGNVVGSNIFNVLFILGVSALITPLMVNAQIIRQEVPIMIGASLLLLAISMDGKLGVVDGLVLFTLVIAYTIFLVYQSRKESVSAKEEYSAEFSSNSSWDDRKIVQVLLIVVGLVLLVLGSKWLVTAAITIAKDLGVSDLVIGLTIVAAGTSMPEVATSIVAAVKGERDIAVGNVIGSNTFNILACLGLSAMVSGNTGLTISENVLNFDLWIMMAVAIACLPIFAAGQQISRFNGALFLFYYVVYTSYLILMAQDYSVATLNAIMLSFVLPLTIISVVIVFLRHNTSQSLTNRNHHVE